MSGFFSAMCPWIALAYDAPLAAPTALFLIYLIGQGSFDDGMPDGISGTFRDFALQLLLSLLSLIPGKAHKMNPLMKVRDSVLRKKVRVATHAYFGRLI